MPGLDGSAGVYASVFSLRAIYWCQESGIIGASQKGLVALASTIKSLDGRLRRVEAVAASLSTPSSGTPTGSLLNNNSPRGVSSRQAPCHRVVACVSLHTGQLHCVGHAGRQRACRVDDVIISVFSPGRVRSLVRSRCAMDVSMCGVPSPKLLFPELGLTTRRVPVFPSNAV